MFIDPYVLASTDTAWCRRGHAIVSDFFQHLVDLLQNGEARTAIALLARCREDNRTHTGYSKGPPQGTAWGEEKATIFIDKLTESGVLDRGRIVDIEDGALLAEKIGPDTISDLMVNLLREQLCSYTLEQCELHGIPVGESQKMTAWQPGQGWVEFSSPMPAPDDMPIILVPRSILRNRPLLSTKAFLQDFLDHYVDTGDRRATRALERALQKEIPLKKKKDGSATVHRKKLADYINSEYSPKKIMTRIDAYFPDAREGYKSRARKDAAPTSAEAIELSRTDRQATDRDGIVEEMRRAARDADVAWAGTEVVGGLLAACHPLLQHPRVVQSTRKDTSVVSMSTTGRSGILRQVRATGADADLLVLVTRGSVDALLMHDEWLSKLVSENNGGGLLIVGSSISEECRRERPALSVRGRFATTFSELSDLVGDDLPAEIVVDRLTATVKTAS